MSADGCGVVGWTVVGCTVDDDAEDEDEDEDVEDAEDEDDEDDEDRFDRNDEDRFDRNDEDKAEATLPPPTMVYDLLQVYTVHTPAHHNAAPLLVLVLPNRQQLQNQECQQQ